MAAVFIILTSLTGLIGSLLLWLAGVGAMMAIGTGYLLAGALFLLAGALFVALVWRQSGRAAPGGERDVLMPGSDLRALPGAEGFAARR